MSKINPWLSAAVALVGAAAWFQPAVAGSDLWWHLASGRDILALGEIPTADPYSHTQRGAGWTNHEWLWGVLYWALYGLHGALPAWLNLGVLLTAYGFALALAARLSGSALAAGAGLWLAAASAHWFLDIRPHLFTLLFVSLFLFSRDRPWARWLWAPTMLIWANLHAGFVFGVGMIGLHVLGKTLEAALAALRSSDPGPTRLAAVRDAVPLSDWAFLGAAMLAPLANPSGIFIIEYPLAYLDRDSPFRQIVEWKPPSFAIDPLRFDGRFWLLAAVTGASSWAALRRSPYLVALAVVTFAMAFTSRRFIPLFGITAIPVIAIGVSSALRRAQSLAPVLSSPAVSWCTLAVAVAATAWLWSSVRLTPGLLDRWTQTHYYPEAAVRYLTAIDPPERLFNLYNWGGYLMLHAPGVPVFIDGRANTVYDERTYDDYHKAANSLGGYRVILARHGVDMVMMPSQSRLVRNLMSGPNPWRAIYADRSAALLVPPGSPYLAGKLPEPGSVVGDHPDWVSLVARKALLEKNYDEAYALLERALAENPLHLSLYTELAAVHANQGDLDSVAEVIERGLRTYPREFAQLRESEAFFLERGGRLDAAIESLREAVPRGPFRSPAALRKRIERLEKRRSG